MKGWQQSGEMLKMLWVYLQKERKKDKINVLRVVQAPKTQVHTIQLTMLIIQSPTSTFKKEDMGVEEIMCDMWELQIKLVRLEEKTSIINLKAISKQWYIQRCIWCNDVSHTKKDYNEFDSMVPRWYNIKLEWLFLKTIRSKTLETRLKIKKALTKVNKASLLLLYVLSN